MNGTDDLMHSVTLVQKAGREGAHGRVLVPVFVSPVVHDGGPAGVTNMRPGEVHFEVAAHRAPLSGGKSLYAVLIGPWPGQVDGFTGRQASTFVGS